VFEFVRTPEVEHVGAVQRERAAYARTRDHVPHAERAHACERFVCGGERFGCGISDTLDRDQRHVRECLAIVRLCEEFFGRAQHRHHHARVVARRFELACVPARDRRAHGLGVVGHAQEFLRRDPQFRIQIERHHVAIVGRAIEAKSERRARVCGRAAGEAVEQFPFAIVERA
jgi:hypothetical protein